MQCPVTRPKGRYDHQPIMTRKPILERNGHVDGLSVPRRAGTL